MTGWPAACGIVFGAWGLRSDSEGSNQSAIITEILEVFNISPMDAGIAWYCLERTNKAVLQEHTALSVIQIREAVRLKK